MNKIRIDELLNNGKYNLLVFCGNSGCGKSTFESLLINNFPEQFRKLPQITTRPMRVSERNGREYYFTDNEVYKTLRKSLIARLSNFNGYKYGTIPLLNKDKINTVIASYNAIIDIFKSKILKKLPVNIIILHMSIDYDNITSTGKRNTRDKKFIEEEISLNNTLEDICKKKKITYIRYRFEDKNRFLIKTDLFE